MPPDRDRVLAWRFPPRSRASRISSSRSPGSRTPKYPAWIRRVSSTVKNGSKLISWGTRPMARRVKR